jgi:hypothetical protein
MSTVSRGFVWSVAVIVGGLLSPAGTVLRVIGLVRCSSASSG